MMLMIPRGYETAAPGTTPPAEAVAAMMKYNEALKEAGILITLDGLHPPSMGVRVSFEGGKPVVARRRSPGPNVARPPTTKPSRSVRSWKWRTSRLTFRRWRPGLPKCSAARPLAGPGFHHPLQTRGKSDEHE
jgi:hypothetical protein